MIKVESIPMQGIKDLATRNALDVVQRNLQFGFGDKGVATQADLAALRKLINANSTVTQRVKVVTPEPPTPVEGDFVKRTGDLMSGRLGITVASRGNSTVEGQGIINRGYTTHDRAEIYSQFVFYDRGMSAMYAGAVWESLQDGNLDHTPDVSPSWWVQRALFAPTWVKGDWAIGVTYDRYDAVHHVGTNQIWVSLQDGNVGNTPGAAPLWWQQDDFQGVFGSGPGPTYAVGDVVRFGNGLWTSRRASNIGNYPYPYLWDVAKTYRINDQRRYNGVLYTSLANGNVGNVPDVSPLSWVVATENIWWSGATPVINGLQCNSFGLNGAGLGVTFGAAFEAWNGPFPTSSTLGVTTTADRTLVGIEPSVINRNPESTLGKVACDFTFKNRSDAEFFTAMTLGSNKYNIHARATQYSSFPRSTTGEYCGWPTLRKINENAFDISSDQPFSVDTDMYDHTVDQAGQDVWWRWWATGLGPLPATQPLGWEGGIRYIQSAKRLEYHGNIVDGSQIAGWIDFDAPFADYTLAKALNYDYINKGTIWVGRQVFDGTGDAIGGTAGSAQFNGATNLAVGVDAGGGAVLIGYYEQLINGVSRWVPYYSI